MVLCFLIRYISENECFWHVSGSSSTGYEYYFKNQWDNFITLFTWNKTEAY